MSEGRGNKATGRVRMARELPPVGTVLVARHKGVEHRATIVEAPAFPAGRAVTVGDKLYRTMTGAAVAITGHPTNGWRFWKW